MAQEIIRISTINTSVVNVATTEVIKIEGVGLQGSPGVPGDPGGVTSINGEVGIVVLATDNISDSGQTNKYATAAQLTAISDNTSDITTLQNETVVDHGGAFAEGFTKMEVVGHTALMIDEGVKYTIDSSLAENLTVIKIDTTQAGSASDTFIFPLTSMGGLTSFIKHNGDGSSDVITAVGQAELTKVYDATGIYNVVIEAELGFLWGFNGLVDKSKLLNVKNNGNLTIVSNMFFNCSNLAEYTALDKPKAYDGATTSSVFSGCAMTKIDNLKNWDKIGAPKSNRVFTNSVSWDQDISMLDYSTINNLDNFAQNTSFSKTNFDLLILSWHNGVSLSGTQPITGAAVGVGSNQYSASVQTEYDDLVTYGIIFSDGGVAP